MKELRLGIDVACRADHQASLADESGELLWSGHRFRTRPRELDVLWAKIPAGVPLIVVMEPTRNAWVALAAWLQARGAKVVLVPAEQSADLRDYYNKHTKTDRLDSRVLARLPMLHPEGIRSIDGLGPAETLRRVVRHRSSLVRQRSQSAQRLDALIELLGPVWADVLGSGEYNKSSLAVLERCADPRVMKKFGRKRLATLLIRHSRGHFREERADELLALADETIELWAGGGLDFAELAEDIAAEVRIIRRIEAEIEAVEERIEALYDEADPKGIIISAPAVGVTLAAGILGRTGDFNRFSSLAGVRAFTGLVPKVSQSGNVNHYGPPTKSGDPGLRLTVFLAADLARKVDPTLAAKYHRLMVTEGKHHTSALCSIAPMFLTRIAACWRKGEYYQLRDVDGRQITEAEGRAICKERYTVSPSIRAARRQTTKAQRLKNGAGRRSEESTKAAPAFDPPIADDSEKVA
jgi:transposase